jgi:hypothetical protein
METYRSRTLIFFTTLFTLEMILALWVGLGWFLLAETTRRAVIAIPWIYVPFLHFLRGPTRAREELATLSKSEYRLRYIVRFSALIIWVIITVVAFAKANFTLIEIFNN